MIRPTHTRIRLALGYAAAVALIAVAGVLLGSCATTGAPPGAYPRYAPAPGTPVDANRPGQPSRGPLLASVTTEPDLRVRIARRASVAAFTADHAVYVGPGPGVRTDARPRLLAPPLSIRHSAKGFDITDGNRRTLRWALPSLMLRPARDATLGFGEGRYPGVLVLVPGTAADTLDVVNHVPLETYLPGVLERELYGSWHPTTFRAQAIAARSYALWERTLAPHRSYDLESTQASQVYGGAATNPKAIDAVRGTRGVVLTYNQRVVPAFFSAAHGPRGQSAAVAFPNRVEDIPPIRGVVTGGWDQACPKYRWGPFSRDLNTLSRRIAAWGKANNHPVAALRTIVSITIPQTSATGRPAVFQITDSAGRRYDLPPESFRFACNYQAAGLPEVSKATTLYSSDVQATIRGTSVVFSNGQGFGHGVGLSQWGAQAMALAGHDHPAILLFYYPQSRLERAY